MEVLIDIDEQKLKKLIKEAIIEVFEERGDELHDLIADVILEDMALARAIKEGESSERASREEVFDILSDRLDTMQQARGMWKDRTDLPTRNELWQDKS
jgi:hypothetical protein